MVYNPSKAEKMKKQKYEMSLFSGANRESLPHNDSPSFQTMLWEAVHNGA